MGSLIRMGPGDSNGLWLLDIQILSTWLNGLPALDGSLGMANLDWMVVTVNNAKKNLVQGSNNSRFVASRIEQVLTPQHLCVSVCVLCQCLIQQLGAPFYCVM